MSFFSSPDPPPVAAPPPPVLRKPARRQATVASKGVAVAREEQRTRAQLAFARRGGTLVTGAGGLQTTASTQKAVLLGQV